MIPQFSIPLPSVVFSKRGCVVTENILITLARMFATIPPTNSLKFLFSFIFFWKSLSFLTPFPWERLMGPPWAATAQQWRDFSSSWNSGSLGAGARFGAGGSLRAGAPNMFSGSGPGYGGAPPSGPQGAPRTTSDPWGKVMLNQTFLPLLKCNVALCHVVVVSHHLKTTAALHYGGL